LLCRETTLIQQSEEVTEFKLIVDWLTYSWCRVFMT